MQTMELGALALVSLLLFSSLGPISGEDVTVKVKSATVVARTDETFVCATLDWWPPEKCNYDQCPWGLASILNLDLKNPILYNAVKAFGSLRIRLGGSLQDQVVYGVGRRASDCPQFKNTSDGMFGFTEGCLTMPRWDELNEFLCETGAVVTFGLNALSGRHKASSDPDDGLWVGPWDTSNAEDFISYTLSKGYNVESWELGNELCGGGVSAKVDPVQYGQDMIALKQLLSKLYHNSSSLPKLLAPGGFFDPQWFTQFLQTSGPNVVDVVTHHIYNLGPGNDAHLIDKIQDPYYLSQVSQTYKDVEATVENFAPWSSAWVGESGGAYNSGGRDVSHTFVDGYWYLDQLGMTSTFNHKAFCRQALIGGNYALLNTTSFIPNPDYYGALLWHRLMGPGVLSVSHDGSPYLRSYAHCSKHETGITLLLINMSNSTAFDVTITNDLNQATQEGGGGGVAGRREEYHLTPAGHDIHSDVLLLNQSPLRLTASSGIPDLKPAVVEDSSPINLVPQSIAFVRLNDFRAPACA
uniref:Heparanase-like protein 1 n=1 Tax=Anthurium amnicola TaxID=1678845 RepID=A0A1D1YZ15_9ARAE